MSVAGMIFTDFVASPLDWRARVFDIQIVAMRVPFFNDYLQNVLNSINIYFK